MINYYYYCYCYCIAGIAVCRGTRLPNECLTEYPSTTLWPFYCRIETLEIRPRGFRNVKIRGAH